MGCACGKRRQPPAYITTPRTTEEQTPPEPTILRLPSGEERTFEDALAAHAARLRFGGEIV